MILEKENFKIDSSNWEIKTVDWWEPFLKHEIKIKVNPEWDIIEYISWLPEEMIWEQLFTYNAAIRETEKNNKRIPTIENIKWIIEIEDSEWIRFIFLDEWNKSRTKWYDFVDLINLKSLWLCYPLEGKYVFWNIDNFDYRWLLDESVVCLRSDMYDFNDFQNFSWSNWNIWFCSVRCYK